MPAPTKATPLWFRLLWVAVAFWVCWWQGPEVVGGLWPSRANPQDFFQEWASAKNRFEGLPVYTSQEVTIERYLGVQRRADQVLYIKVNAHPPPAVLLAVPLAGLEYEPAFLIWSLLSLLAFGVSIWLVLRELAAHPSWWTLAPAVVLLIVCNPMRQQLSQGQLNSFLLLLITGAWVADRRERPVTAGLLLGIATAIKLFPGFLVLYFLLRGQWRAVFASIVSFLLLTGLTVAVLGVDAYIDYVRQVLPEVGHFRTEWINASLIGFWSKLFDPAAAQTQVEPLWPNATLARFGSMLSCAIVVCVWVWCLRRAYSRSQLDRAYGLAITTMLLVSPITWDHYFLLLLVPLALLWIHLPSTGIRRWSFFLVLVGLWVNIVWLYTLVYNLWKSGGWHQQPATPLVTLTLLSIQCYALIGLFLLQCRSSPNHSSQAS